MEDYIPISFINALAYCPRRFYYEYVQAEMLLNEYVVEGRLLHEHSDEGGTLWKDGVVQQRRVYVWSERLRLAGLIDVVEWSDGGIVPVEYKRGALGRWRNDHAQLCAQALCLEERLSVSIAHGYIFSFSQRRRELVEFTPELRSWTESLAAEAQCLALQKIAPPPIDQRARCKACSLEPLCLPDEVRRLQQGVTAYEG
ncbi:MAG: CRISPR-associated protein Cas4 [Herpetosiphonaceae bacterium]|nr:MAG: CRISPR-associated protein Cas4 [Herpetosiphonaceae bacterium]